MFLDLSIAEVPNNSKLVGLNLLSLPFLSVAFTCVLTLVLSNLKSPTSVWERERERVGKKECVPPLQFGEIYEWTKLKSVRVYTQREFGRRDLRSAVWVIIQSSRSHISHFESHRLWGRTDLSYTQVAHVQAPKSREKQKQHTLTNSHTRWFFILRECDPCIQ